MKVIGKGAVCKEEKKERSKCRKWRLVVKTDQGDFRERFTGTYTQARARCDALVQEVADGACLGCDCTFGEWADRWVEVRAKDADLKRSTIKNEQHALDRVTEKVGSIPLSDLTPTMMSEALSELRSDRGLSGTYMHKLHSVTKHCLKDAYFDGLIPSNPMDRVKAPRIDTEKRKALDRTKFNDFIKALVRQPLSAYTVALMLAVMAGMRRGEICALRWQDVEGGMIRVRNGIDESTGEIDTTKTPNGVRDIPTVKELDSVLTRWKAEQRAKLGRQTSKTPVCAAANGRHMRPQNLYRWWRENRGLYGLDGVRLHDLRHTYLTLMAAQGAPASVLKALAGWADISMANIYVHEDDDASLEATRRFGEIISLN